MPTQLQNRPRIVFDTNMLLAIQQLHIDVFSETKKMFGAKAELLIPKQVFEELRNIDKGEGVKRAVRIALDEIERCGVKIVDVDASNADSAIAKMAMEGCFAASNDAILRKRIKSFAGKVIYLRQRRFLEIG